MVWNQFGGFIDLDPDPDPSNFVDPDTNNPDHWITGSNLLFCLSNEAVSNSYINNINKIGTNNSKISLYNSSDNVLRKRWIETFSKTGAIPGGLELWVHVIFVNINSCSVTSWNIDTELNYETFCGWNSHLSTGIHIWRTFPSSAFSTRVSGKTWFLFLSSIPFPPFSFLNFSILLPGPNNEYKAASIS